MKYFDRFEVAAFAFAVLALLVAIAVLCFQAYVVAFIMKAGS